MKVKWDFLLIFCQVLFEQLEEMNDSFVFNGFISRLDKFTAKYTWYVLDYLYC